MLVLVSCLLLGVPKVWAESSATAYDATFRSQQVFVVAYNNSGGTLNRDNVVILDRNGTGVTAGTTLGSYITTTTTTDSIYVFGVTDESIPNGTLGRVCVRGPHKAVSITSQTSSSFNTVGNILSASSTAGTYGFYTTADGTAGGRLGYLINATATTDTGDASNTFWIWVEPSRHK